MKKPFINVEEKIDRFVGRRLKTPDALSTVTRTKANSIAWRKAFGGIRAYQFLPLRSGTFHSGPSVWTSRYFSTSSLLYS